MSDEDDRNDQSKTKFMWIGIGLGIGGAVLILALVLYWWKRNNPQSMTPANINKLNIQRILKNPSVNTEMINLLK